ncbi:unnamed protein product [Scytosiphon promiscuus]
MSVPTPGPVPRATRALSLLGLAAECSAFVVQSLRPTNPFFNIDVSPMPYASGCVRPARWVSQRRESSAPMRNAERNLFIMAANPERSLGEVSNVNPNTEISEAATSQEALRKGVVKDSNRSAMGSLQDAFGTGRGKHAGKKRRRHSNKYASKSKAADLDPWEKQLRKSEEKSGEAEARERAELEELEQRRIERRIERGLVEYPDEEEIDPYDPSTFGYIEVGQILGAHGIKGEVKVRSSTDFAVSRLCTPGIKHIKAPNRRFPRDVELLGGRWQKNEIFLLQIEVSGGLSLVFNSRVRGKRMLRGRAWIQLTQYIAIRSIHNAANQTNQMPTSVDGVGAQAVLASLSHVKQIAAAYSRSGSIGLRSCHNTSLWHDPYETRVFRGQEEYRKPTILKVKSLRSDPKHTVFRYHSDEAVRTCIVGSIVYILW